MDVMQGEMIAEGRGYHGLRPWIRMAEAIVAVVLTTMTMRSAME